MLNRFVKVTVMAFAVFTYDRFCFLVSQVFDALLSLDRKSTRLNSSHAR